MDIIIILLRYILIFILYLFIFRVMVLVVRDIKATKTDSAFVAAELPIEEDAFYLIIVQSNVPELTDGTKIKLGKENYIGRGSDNYIQIPDSFTSHRHARLTLINGQFRLEDLGSKNGTFVDGVRIEKPVTLVNGGLFQIGGVTFRLERWT